ncbi:unnamed protein product [Acanthosepion pharaonis]|uniref:Uncharacterized protein n=1 Tax=Acanthosepion pharaonis TaxID=158019 RepID=A0A812B0N2_ACAPH|nr:unnamed protein product [Sepia pharaonis]
MFFSLLLICLYPSVSLLSIISLSFSSPKSLFTQFLSFSSLFLLSSFPMKNAISQYMCFFFFYLSILCHLFLSLKHIFFLFIIFSIFWNKIFLSMSFFSLELYFSHFLIYSFKIMLSFSLTFLFSLLFSISLNLSYHLFFVFLFSPFLFFCFLSLISSSFFTLSHFYSLFLKHFSFLKLMTLSIYFSLSHYFTFRLFCSYLFLSFSVTTLLPFFINLTFYLSLSNQIPFYFTISIFVYFTIYPPMFFLFYLAYLSFFFLFLFVISSFLNRAFFSISFQFHSVLIHFFFSSIIHPLSGPVCLSLSSFHFERY